MPEYRSIASVCSPRISARVHRTLSLYLLLLTDEIHTSPFRRGKSP